DGQRRRRRGGEGAGAMTERASRLRSRAGVGPPDDDPLDPDVVPALAHRALVRGDQRSAFDLLLDAIRQGGWRHGWLWSELADAAAEPDDYGAVRELWLHSPPACHHDVPI